MVNIFIYLENVNKKYNKIPLEWLELKMPENTVLVSIWNNWNSDGIQMAQSLFRYQLGSFKLSKVTCMLIKHLTLPSNFISKNLPKSNKNTYPYKDLYIVK